MEKKERIENFVRYTEQLQNIIKYRLFKRTTNRNEDISLYIRFFTNGDSIKDDIPLYISKFSDIYLEYKD